MLERVPDDFALAVPLAFDLHLFTIVFKSDDFDSARIDGSACLQVSTQVVAGAIAQYEIGIATQGHPVGQRPERGLHSFGGIRHFREGRGRGDGGREQDRQASLRRKSEYEIFVTDLERPLMSGPIV